MTRILSLFFVWIAALALAQAPALLTQPQIDQYVTDLDSAKYKVREKAQGVLSDALINQFVMTEASLKAAIANPLSLEQRLRADLLLAKCAADQETLLVSLHRAVLAHQGHRSSVVVLNLIQKQLDRGEKLRDAIVKAGFEIEKQTDGDKETGVPPTFIVKKGGQFHRVLGWDYSIGVQAVTDAGRGRFNTSTFTVPLDQFTTAHQRAARGFAPNAQLPGLALELPVVTSAWGNRRVKKIQWPPPAPYQLGFTQDTPSRITDFFVLRLGFNRNVMEAAYLQLKERHGITFYGHAYYDPR